MEYEKKYFGNGSGNFDDADFILQPNQWINMENCRIGSTDKGVIGTVESIGKVLLLSDPEPSVTNVVIGSVPDDENRRIIYFLKDLHGPWDKIVCYDLVQDIFLTVLYSYQVVGGLNFNKNSLIHSARIINGLLYWTDNLNQPRRINIDAGINLNYPTTIPDVEPYTIPINSEVITIIRRPPAYTLTVSKTTDPDIESNLIKYNAFRFAYRYRYRDGEISTISPHSLLANYNYSTEDFNAIFITVQLTEVIDQDVQQLEIIVYYAEGETGYVIKTWDKANAVDAAEIIAHNAGSGALTFQFSNDEVGEAIDSASLIKPFDSVPLLSETLEQATNRLLLGRNLLGYDTPVTTSLTAEIVQQEGDLVGGTWYEVSVTYGGGTDCFQYYFYFAYFATDVDGTHPAGFYDLTSDRLHWNNNTCPGTFFPPIAFVFTIDINDYTHVGTTASDLYAYIPLHDDAKTGGGTPSGRSFHYANATLFSVFTQGGGTASNISILKSDSAYRLGIVFYDKYLRQCGVVKGPKVTTPDRIYNDFAVYDYAIQWSLNSGAQPDEIPDWAIYYSIVITKSLRTTFFLQSRAGEILYATKDADGNYEFTSTTFADSNAGVALKLDLLFGNGMGYSFQAGDLIKIYRESTGGATTVAIIDQVGEWVIGELVDFGDLSSENALFEIYTPRPNTAGELYYEIGKIYPIVNPGDISRTYSITIDTIPGDVYILTRGTSPDEYRTENMSPNTTFWRNWFTNAGRLQIIDKIGQRYKETSIKWSNTFIPGTITNGLSSFDALDEKILPGEMGALRKLQVTSKVNNEQGAVMLAICESETASIYLGETQLVGSASNAFVAQSTGVLGTINILKGSHGTMHPESVIEFRGNVYWVDALNGDVVQYSLNGLFPISNYKMTRYWKLFCEQYLSMMQAQIEALGSRPFIFTTVDPYHQELLISVPKLLNTPPRGYLPDYPDRVYPFDIWDGQAKTLVYKLAMEPNFWQGAYTYTGVEGFVTIQNRLFQFRNGLLFELNSTSSAGASLFARIMFIANQQPSRPKVYNNISLEVNLLPRFTYFMSEQPYQQVSNLQDFDYENKEGVLYSQIYRNVLTPSATGLVPNALVVGERMRTYAFRIMLEFDTLDTPLELRFVNIGYSISLGHKT